MKELEKVILNLGDLRHLKPAKEESVVSSEDALGLKFAEDYRFYVKRFGAISAGAVELTGVVESERLNVVDVTNKERELNEKFPRDLYVIENVGIEGIVVLQNANGEVFSFDGVNPPKKYANSLKEYLETHF